nr:maleylacetoacetate isomerase [Oceanococcus sp. HetDA_MAG_MS8]
MHSPLRLYGYWRSSSTWRVRIALALKGLEAQHCPINLIQDGGQQHLPEHLARNPQAQVPVLEHNGRWLSQSLAICEYLDTLSTQGRLLPTDPWQAAQIRSLAQVIACDIQPLQNLRVLQTVEDWGIADHRAQWASHWISQGLTALNNRVEHAADLLNTANCPGLFELCLIPQLFNARRFDIDVAAYPALEAIEQSCMQQDAFVSTRPENQPEATSA